MDGRKLPKDPFASFMGYSIGHWEGDELVVESVGFKERHVARFRRSSAPEQLRMTERYRRIDFGHMRREITVVDPGMFKSRSSWQRERWMLTPDTELLEYVCAETPRERFRSGRTDGEGATGPSRARGSGETSASMTSTGRIRSDTYAPRYARTASLICPETSMEIRA